MAHCWPVGSSAIWEPLSSEVNAVSLPPLLALQSTAGDMVLILACSGIEGGHVSSRRRGSPLRPQGSWDGQGHQANRAVSIPPPLEGRIPATLSSWILPGERVPHPLGVFRCACG